jgi:predicted NUDIX family NTP pyrophosphohydrolase
MIESSGLLLFRHRSDGSVEVLIGHMGGPYWVGKPKRSWSVPKGLHDHGEHQHLAVAEREFEEEMGSPPPRGPTIALGSVRAGRKTITVFARQGDFDAEAAVSNTFSIEWPPRSGKIQEFAEIDRAAWKTLAEARPLLTEGQSEFLDRLAEHLSQNS